MIEILTTLYMTIEFFASFIKRKTGPICNASIILFRLSTFMSVGKSWHVLIEISDYPKNLRSVYEYPIESIF